MKRVLIVIFFLNSLSIYSQVVIPNFNSNATLHDSTSNEEYLKFISKFDVSVSLRRSCYWYGHMEYKTIALENDTWVKFIILTDFTAKHNIFKKRKIKIIKEVCDQTFCDSITKELINNRLFTMNIDSLHTNFKQIDDSTKESISISDGVLYEFIVRNNNKIKIVWSYEPEAYYKWLPEIIERKYFIDCKNAFENLWKK